MAMVLMIFHTHNTGKYFFFIVNDDDDGQSQPI